MVGNPSTPCSLQKSESSDTEQSIEAVLISPKTLLDNFVQTGANCLQ